MLERRLLVIKAFELRIALCSNARMMQGLGPGTGPRAADAVSASRMELFLQQAEDGEAIRHAIELQNAGQDMSMFMRDPYDRQDEMTEGEEVEVFSEESTDDEDEQYQRELDNGFFVDSDEENQDADVVEGASDDADTDMSGVVISEQMNI